MIVKLHDSRAVADMLHGNGNVTALQQPHKIIEALKLLLRVSLILHIRAGQMGEQSLYRKSRQLPDFFHKSQPLLIRGNTDPGHSRIQCDMYPGRLSKLHGFL